MQYATCRLFSIGSTLKRAFNDCQTPTHKYQLTNTNDRLIQVYGPRDSL